MSVNRSTGITIAVLLGACFPCVAAGQGQPITGIRFDWSTYQRHAPGSDNWPLTWCEDDYQYGSWGDGGGFGGANRDGRVSLGFARIEGQYPDSWQGVNIWGGRDPENQALFGGKVTSMICINGNLYAWHSRGGRETAFAEKKLIKSSDKGAHWDEDAFPFSKLRGDTGLPGLPYFINYGKDYAANEDGYVYIYTIRIEDKKTWDVQKPGVIWLARAPVTNEAFVFTANWEWFIGIADDGSPNWGSIRDREAVIEDPDGFMRNSAIYNPGLDRYLMVVNHTTRNEGNIAIYEASEPWGPWNIVLKEFGWPRDDPNAPARDVLRRNFAFGSFSPKWLSADGRDCVFVWFRPDAWNSVGCQFLVDR